MTKSTITRERIEQYANDPRMCNINDEIRELARMALAAMDSEPVAWTDEEELRDVNVAGIGYLFGIDREANKFADPRRQIMLYRHAQQPVDSEPVGYLFHNEYGAVLYSISDDATEGFSLIGPIYSVPQPAPVVPENCVTAEHRRVIEMLLNVCGAAFELADDSCQQDVDGEDCHVVPDDAFQKLSDALDEIENTLPTEDIDRPDVFLAWSAMPRAALKSLLQAGNSPVIPDGYVMVPMRLTAENGAKGALSGEFSETKSVNCPECFGDDECETCDGSGRIEIKVPVSWTTIKEIWIKGVEHFAAAPQENN